MSALIDAVRARDVEEVARLLGEKANRATLNNDGHNAMYYADRINLGAPRGMITNLLETAPYVDMLEQQLEAGLEGEKPADFEELMNTLRRTVYDTAGREESPGDFAFALYYKVEDLAKRTREEILENGGAVNVANRTAVLAAIENAQELGGEDELLPGLMRLDELRNAAPVNGVVAVGNNNVHWNAAGNEEGADIAAAEAEFNAIQAEHAAAVAAATSESQIANLPNNANQANANENEPKPLGGRRKKSRKQKKSRKAKKQSLKRRRTTRRK